LGRSFFGTFAAKMVGNPNYAEIRQGYLNILKKKEDDFNSSREAIHVETSFEDFQKYLEL